MDDIILSLYGSHNDAALLGVKAAAQKVASEHGDEGVALFESWLDGLDAGAIFDLDNDPEKTASECEEADFNKIAEADFLGRVMYHAFENEKGRHEKMADYVEGEVLQSFYAAHQEAE